MLTTFNDDPDLLKNFITGDESWVYGYDIETKAQSFQCKRPEEPRPKKARQFRSNVKVATLHVYCLGDVDDVQRRSRFAKKVITGDESWVYGYDIETKAQSSQWKRPEESKPLKTCQVRSNANVLLTVKGSQSGFLQI